MPSLGLGLYLGASNLNTGAGVPAGNYRVLLGTSTVRLGTQRVIMKQEPANG